jgi:peptidoglycan/xylan/chitin deacetylase (PgdA/CDA1 family)
MTTLLLDLRDEFSYGAISSVIEAETQDTFFGGQSFRVTGDTDANAGIDCNGAEKFAFRGPTNRQNFVGLVKVSDYTKISKLQALVYSPGGSGNVICEYDIQNAGGFSDHQYNGWHLAVFQRGTADNGGACRAITRVIWRGDPVAGEDVGTLTFDAMWATSRQPVPVIFTFDDGHQRSIDDGMYWLEGEYGWYGAIGPIRGLIGTTGASPYSTKAQLHAAYDRGHDVYTHGATPLTTLSLAEARADVRANLEVISEIGDRCSDFYVYPNGARNRAIDLMLAEEGIRYARMATSTPTSQTTTTPVASINGWVPPQREIPYVLRNVNVNATAAADSFVDAAAGIDYCISAGAPIFLSIHDLYDSGASDPHINRDDFRSFVRNVIAPRVRAGWCYVARPSTWFREFARTTDVAAIATDARVRRAQR